MMKKTTGLGRRLRQALIAKGYADHSAKFGVAVMRFTTSHGYPQGYFYKWLADVVVPSTEMMMRLAADLDVTPGWLHYGDQPVPSARGRARPPRSKPPVAARSGPSRRGAPHPQPQEVAQASMADAATHEMQAKSPRVGALRQLRGQTTASAMHYSALAAAHGTRRRAA